MCLCVSVCVCVCVCVIDRGRERNIPKKSCCPHASKVSRSWSVLTFFFDDVEMLFESETQISLHDGPVHYCARRNRNRFCFVLEFYRYVSWV